MNNNNSLNTNPTSRRSTLRIGTLVKSAALDQRIAENIDPTSTSTSSSTNTTVTSTVAANKRRYSRQHDPDLETAIALSLVETYKKSRGPSPKLSLTALKPKRRRNSKHNDNEQTTENTEESTTTTEIVPIISSHINPSNDHISTSNIADSEIPTSSTGTNEIIINSHASISLSTHITSETATVDSLPLTSTFVSPVPVNTNHILSSNHSITRSDSISSVSHPSSALHNNLVSPSLSYNHEAEFSPTSGMVPHTLTSTPFLPSYTTPRPKFILSSTTPASTTSILSSISTNTHHNTMNMNIPCNVPDILSQEFNSDSQTEYMTNINQHEHITHSTVSNIDLPNKLIQSTPDIVSPPQNLAPFQANSPDILSQEIEPYPESHELTTNTEHYALVPDVLSQEYETPDLSDSHLPDTSHELVPHRAIEPDIISQEMDFPTSMDEAVDDYTEEFGDKMDTENVSSVDQIPSNDIFISPSSEISALSNISNNNTNNQTVEHTGPEASTTVSSTLHDANTAHGVADRLIHSLSSLPPLPSSLRFFVAQHAASSPCEDHWFAGSTMDYTDHRLTKTEDNTGSSQSSSDSSVSYQQTMSLRTGEIISSSDIRNHSPDELAYIFTIFDGHGGPKVAEFASTHLPSRVINATRYAQTIPEIIDGIKYAFLMVDKHYLSTYKNTPGYEKFGSCVNLVFIRKVGKYPHSRWMIFTANAGDSRCVLASEQKVTTEQTISSNSTHANYEQFRGNRSSLLDPRLHNKVADAAGIPSVVCGEDGERPIALSFQSSTIDAVMKECNKHTTNHENTESSTSISTMSEYFSHQVQNLISVDHVQRAMALAALFNAGNPHTLYNDKTKALPNTSSTLFSPGTFGRTISKAAAMGIGATLLHYALSLTKPHINDSILTTPSISIDDTASTSSSTSARTSQLYADLSVHNRIKLIDQLLLYRRQSLYNQRMLALPLSMDHTCSNPVEIEDVKLRSKELNPIRTRLMDKPLLKSHSNSSSHANALLSSANANINTSFLRVGGSLTVTRALGDVYLKSEEHTFSHYPGCPYISGEPEVTWRIIQPGDRFLVLGSDGIWDTLSNAQVLEVVSQSLCDEVTLPILQSFGKEITTENTAEPTVQEEINRAYQYFHHVQIPYNNISDSSLSLTHDTIDIGLRVPPSLGQTNTSLSRSNSNESAKRIRSDSDIPSSLNSHPTSLFNHVHASGLFGLHDVYLGNPAQRLLGAALAQQAKKQNENCKTNTNPCGILDMLRFQCKTPSTRTTELSYTRRGFHDDMTTIIVLLPQFMINENMNNHYGAVMDIDTAGLSSRNSGARFIIDGIEMLPLAPLQERFNKSMYDQVLEWRSRVRETRIQKGAQEWPIISLGSSNSSITSTNSTTISRTNSYGNYVYNQQQQQDLGIQRSRSFQSNHHPTSHQYGTANIAPRSNTISVFPPPNSENMGVRRAVSEPGNNHVFNDTKLSRSNSNVSTHSYGQDTSTPQYINDNHSVSSSHSNHSTTSSNNKQTGLMGWLKITPKVSSLGETNNSQSTAGM